MGSGWRARTRGTLRQVGNRFPTYREKRIGEIKRSMFFIPKNLKYSKIVSLESPQKAQHSVTELKKEFKKGRRN